MVPSIQFSVPGTAAGLTAAGQHATAWKWCVAEAARQHWKGPLLAEPVALDLVFGVPDPMFSRLALPNLLKHTIDGLAYVLFAEAQDSKRGPWDREDWWIVQLSATKVAVPEPAVSVSIAHPERSVERTERAIHAHVSGTPRPWVTQGEADWKADIRRALASQDERSDFNPLAMALTFRLASREMIRTDIDNLVVPAAMACAQALLTGVRFPATRIEHIHATKVAAGGPETQGLSIAAWRSNP